MYLCKEYARSQGIKTDNMRNIIASNLYRVARTFLCISKILSAASHVHAHVGRNFWHDWLNYFRYLLKKNCVFVINTGIRKKYELIKKNPYVCIQLLRSKRREVGHFINNMCSEFQSVADFCVHLSCCGPWRKFLPELPQSQFELISSLVFSRKASEA